MLTRLLILPAFLMALILSGCGASKTGLTKAISEGDRAAAIKSIQDGADVREVDGLGNSPLELAIQKNDPELVGLILDKGASADEAGLICKAIKSGEGKENTGSALKIVKSLVKHGAKTDKNNCDISGIYPDKERSDVVQVAPIALAISLAPFSKDRRIVDFLFSQKTDKNPTLPPIFFAAKSAQWDLVNELHKRGSKLDGALYASIVSNQDYKVIEYLKAGANPNNSSMNMMKTALKYKNKKIINALMKYGYKTSSYSAGTSEKSNQLLLRDIIKTGDSKSAIQFMSLHGINLSSYPADPKSKNDQSYLIDAIRMGDYDLVKKFLMSGANPNLNNRSTPLCMAISLANLGNIRVVDKSLKITNLLIASGANVNTPCDSIGMKLKQTSVIKKTPLIVSSSRERNYPITKALLVTGANPNYHGGSTSSALYRASSGSAQTVALLVSMGADVNYTGPVFNETPLFEAVRYGEVESVGILLKAGANPNAKDSQGNTPIEYAEHAKHKGSPKILTMLREHSGQKESSGLSFGKLFATAAIAGLANSANISAGQKADVMSATVNDIWIKDGKGTQLNDMLKSGASGGSGNPLLDDLMNTKREQQNASDMYKKEMKKYQATIRQQREKREQKPTLYQQQLDRIANQNNGKMALKSKSYKRDLSQVDKAASLNQQKAACDAKSGKFNIKNRSCTVYRQNNTVVLNKLPVNRGGDNGNQASSSNNEPAFICSVMTPVDPKVGKGRAYTAPVFTSTGVDAAGSVSWKAGKHMANKCGNRFIIGWSGQPSKVAGARSTCDNKTMTCKSKPETFYCGCKYTDSKRPSGGSSGGTARGRSM